MKLTSLEFENFMSFKKRKFDLSKPLNVVCGRNGSGKSSILEGIALSFQIKERNNAVGSYIRKVPEGVEDKPKKATVILKGEYLGKPLTIKSDFHDSGGRKITRLVEYNGEKYENTKANNFLSKFFTESKMTLAFSLQGNERYITSSGAVNLKNIKDLLGLCYDEKIDTLKVMNKEVNTEYSNANLKYNMAVGKLNTLTELQVESSNKIEEIEKFLKESKPQDSSKLIQKLEALKEQKYQLTNSLNDYNNKLSSYTNYINSLKNCDKYIEMFKKETAELNLVEPTPYDKEEKELKEVEEQFKVKDSKLVNIKESMIHLDAKTAECLKTFNLIKNGQCPVCKTKLESSKIEEDDKEIKELQKEKEGLQSQYNEVEGEKESLISKGKELNKVIKDCKAQVSEYEKNIALKERLETELSRREEEKKKLLENPITEPEPISDEELKKVSSEISKLESEIDDIVKHNNTILYEKKKLEESKISAEGNANKVKEAEEEKDNLNEEKTKYESKLNIISDANDLLSIVPKKFLSKIVEPLQNRAKGVVSKFGYEFRIKLDDGIVFEIGKPTEEGMIWLPYNSQSSFEKILTNVSFIMSIQSYLGLPFVCLDEIDNSADPVNIKIFKRLMDELSEKLQVILITHDQGSLSEYVQDERVSFININVGGIPNEKLGK